MQQRLSRLLGETIAYTKKKETEKRPLDISHGGSCHGQGHRATRAGQRAARREVQKHKPPSGLRVFQQNFEFPWTLAVPETWIAPPPPPVTAQSPNLNY
jgi:hypothetical protein